MKKIVLLSMIMSVSICAGVSTPMDKQKLEKIKQIQKTYKHKLRKKCRYSSAYFAQQHTQNEWNVLNKKGLFKNEFELLCPKGKNILDNNEMKALYFFAKKYAGDTKNYPKT